MNPSNKILFFLLLIPSLLVGQWTTQTLTLQPGWNAVYLEVDPLPRECSTIFNGIDIESVSGAAAQFELTDPTVSELIYYPFGSTQTSTLFTLQGGHTYAINYLGNTPININISGNPIVSELTWSADIYRETGFHVTATNAPTFEDFLAAEPTFGNNVIERMNANGAWVAITDPSTQTINKGEAYRLKTDEFSNYVAPFTVVLEQDKSLDFGQVLLDQTIRLKNHTNTLKQISLAILDSEDNVFAPYNLAGNVALNYWDTDNKEWANLSNGLVVNVAANEELAIRISVDRLQMPFSSSGQYQSLLELRDGEGTELVVPISSFGLLNRTGLWVGTATINAVNDINLASNSPKATASEFAVKLIVHVDASGEAHLLDQVMQMWDDGSYQPDPENTSRNIVEMPGQYVLITDDNLVPGYYGAAVRDGKQIGRRISTSSFSFDEPQLLTGIFDGTLEDTLVLDYNDPLNPFKHKYHPDHNNMDERNENTLPEGIESYTITRKVQLAFSTNDPDNLSFSGFGDNQAGGTYVETIKGIHKDELFVKGTFRLQRVSNIGKLNASSTAEELRQLGPQPRKAIAEIEEEVDILSSTIEIDKKIPVAQVFPNPVSDKLQLFGLEAGKYTLVVRDVSGKTMLSQAFQANETVNVQQLPPGVYTLEIRAKSWVQNIKFIKG